MVNPVTTIDSSQKLPGPLTTQLRTMFRDQVRNTVWISFIISAVALIGFGIYSYWALTNEEWHFQVLAGLTLLLAVSALGCALIARQNRHRMARWIVLILGIATIFATSVLVVGQAIWLAAAIILFMLVMNALTMSGQDGLRAGLIAVTIALLVLVLDDSTWNWRLSAPVELANFLIGLFIFLLAAYIFFLVILFKDFSLRGKITIAVFSAAIISIVVLTSINNRTYRAALLVNVNQTLGLASRNTADHIDAYLASLFPGLEETASNTYTTAYIKSLSTASQDQAEEGIDYFRGVTNKLGALEMVLLDQVGNVLLHTNGDAISQFDRYLGLYKDDRQSMIESLQNGSKFISNVVFSSRGAPIVEGQYYFYVGVRVVDATRQPLGMLLAAYPLSAIQAIVQANVDLAGTKSFPVLLDDNYLRLANGAALKMNYLLVAPLQDELISELQQSGRIPETEVDQPYTLFEDFRSGLDNLSNDQFFEAQEIGFSNELNTASGVQLKLKNWFLVYMQPRSIVLQPIEQQTRATVLIAALISGLAVLVSALLARLISIPIAQLTQAAEHSAVGDLSLRAPTDSIDEIGKLGIAFNSMIEQLKKTLEGLEERVSERTAELTRFSEQLEYRADRLEMVAEVVSGFTASTDPDQLPSLVVNTISERFGYYHVGIFVIDKYDEYAILVAANSEGGQRMLARGHRLRVGEEGIVGYVTRHGSARIALDVGQDVYFFNNPDLPETRSEITLPLRIGDRNVGALDVQSKLPNAFDSSDIALLTTLANQVAIAMENTRLIIDAQRSVHELELSQRLYIQQEWSKVIEEHSPEGFQYLLGKLLPLSTGGETGPGLVPKTPTVVFEQSVDSGFDRGTGLAVPIQLRGQTIGLIELGDPTPGRGWSADEINLVASVADQVGLALENARLLETTRRRAERERLVSEITTKLRATNDPQAILETAVTQLKHALRVQKVAVHIPTHVDTNEESQE